MLNCVVLRDNSFDKNYARYLKASTRALGNLNKILCTFVVIWSSKNIERQIMLYNVNIIALHPAALCLGVCMCVLCSVVRIYGSFSAK